ncbi:MAG: hypothetical protein AB1458_08760 [Bacteroidota bacterium]
MKSALICFLLLAPAIGLYGQGGQPSKNYKTSKTTLALHAGYQYFTYHGAELGLACARYSRQGGLHYVRACALAAEMIFSDSLNAIGPKASFWLSGGGARLSLGAAAICYINKSSSSLRLRPEVGFGLKRYRLAYGYNFALWGRDLLPLNPHVITFSFLFDLKVLKKNELGTDKPPGGKKAN